MLNLESYLPVHRVFAAAIMLVMLALVLVMHPPAMPEFADQAAEITNIYDADSDDETPAQPQASHHDNPAEMFVPVGLNLTQANGVTIFSCTECVINSFEIVLNRPPRTA